jgi:signal peptidase I
VVAVGPPEHLTSFINKRQVAVQYIGQNAPTVKTFWFAPEETNPERDGFPALTHLYQGETFRKGQAIVSLVDTTGDHLFVDRVTYNFRHPQRGEIIVFKTKGIAGLDQNQFYIKRLIGLPGENVSICDQPANHACINGKPLMATDRHFENVYSFDPKQSPEESRYSGHVRQDPANLRGWAAMSRASEPHLATPDDPIPVRPGHYLVFGDNTMNSLDSRYWGDLPQENVIGKSWFVYWPIGPRFGWGQQ